MTALALALLRRPWLAAAVYLLPLYLLGIVHFAFPGDGRLPTGFVQYDQAGYMASAREHFDHGFTPLYRLASSSDPASPAVNFQPQFLVLGTALWLSDADPGVLFFLAGLVASLVFFRVAIALYRDVSGADSAEAALGLPLFLWGGGLFVAAGGVAGLAEQSYEFRSVLRFDPLHGFWFLNLGRNVYYTLEAYYHAVALGLILVLRRRQLVAAAALVLLLSLSHPYTGVQFVGIALGWCLLERLLGNRSVPLWLIAWCTVVLALHCFYYLWFLPQQSAEYQSLVSQHYTPAPLTLVSAVLGYALVAPLAIAAVARGAWRQPPARVLLVTALGSLALVKHDLLLQATQPLHFDRGYIWSALFLLGLPLLLRAIGWLRRSLTGAGKALALASLFGLFLLDNAFWFSFRIYENLTGFTQFLLRPAEAAVLERLRDPALADYLVVSDNLELGYLATAYSPLSSWLAHAQTTPHAAERRAEIEGWSARGEEPAAWRQRPVLFIAADRGQDLAAAPWLTPDSEIERVEAAGLAYWLVRRPALEARP